MSHFYGTVPANNTAKWHPEPTFRGTFGILSSCLITMALCIWTAVHLNIPEHGQTGFFTRQIRRKILCLLVGLFAPEMILWAAFEQRKVASVIHKRMYEQRWRGEEPYEEKPTSYLSRMAHSVRGIITPAPIKYANRHDWTMVHSHYVAMGGFAVDVSDKDINFFVSKEYTQFTLTVHGFRSIISTAFDIIPNISQAEIWDKSKANGLTKTLVCLQTTWFCAQCIGRLSQGFTISLLELNTFAHAVCTLLIYVLWWDKPLDVEGTTFLQGGKETSAAVLVESQSKLECDFVRQVQPGSIIRTLSFDRLPVQSCDQDPKLWPPQSSFGTFRLSDGDIFHHFHVHPRAQTRGTTSSDKYMDLRADELETLKMAMDERMRRGPNAYSAVELETRKINSRARSTTYGKDYLTLRIDNRAGQMSRSNAPSHGWSGLSGCMFIGFCYGGLHLSAWNAPFPNTAQSIMWKISGIGLISVVPFCTLIISAYVLITTWLDESRDRVSIVLFAKGTLILLFVIFGFFYVLCRIFLVVECFISLGYLPDSVYQVPQWSQYFPHIG